MATSDFGYLRFHGSRELFSSRYSDRELESWADKIRGLGAGVVYAYFNNDVGGAAIANACKLGEMLA
jgi:uncharacterized protein YecE (DUF72 family)